MTNYQEHKKYFDSAYKTGTDIWTHLPMKARGEMLVEQLSPGAIILDIGSGRGLFAKHLVELGFRVIGIDFVSEIVKKTNENVKNWGLQGKLKFVEGNALDIPFTDNSFDGIYDFGLMENLFKEDWEQYAREINRVLKPGGFFLNISFSRETQRFFEFYPKNSKNGEFKKYGIHYHFFDKNELKNIFNHNLNPIKQNIEFIDKPTEIALLETLFKKPK